MNRLFYGVGASVLSLGGYLWWQSQIQPAPYDEMFAVQEHPESQLTRRFIPLSGAVNFRDIGGYTAQDGRRVAWGRVYRSNDLSALTDADVVALTDLHIRTICDLRSPAETLRFPNRVPEGVNVRHIPIFTRDPLSISLLFLRHRLDPIFKWHYRAMIIDEGAAALGAVLKLAADPAHLPLVVHCTSGKDRTGVVTALLLHICGVPRATIVADYMLTNRTIEDFLATYRATMHRYPIARLLKIEQLYPILSARAELIEHALDHITATYGSLDAYLRGPVGLTEAELDAIRANVLV
ncbi:MAG: tyrosine-protein phosphatase [Anaerolineae bacterium]|nr:tyrosine-protein phosphatase [Anaerolineae bacterium]